MKSVNVGLVGFVALAFALGGCKGLLKKRGEDTAASASAVAVTPPPPLPVPPTPAPAETANLDNVDAPVPEDFEEEAFKEITQANFRAEFEKLKKEIDPGTVAATAK